MRVNGRRVRVFFVRIGMDLFLELLKRAFLRVYASIMVLADKHIGVRLWTDIGQARLACQGEEEPYSSEVTL